MKTFLKNQWWNLGIVTVALGLSLGFLGHGCGKASATAGGNIDSSVTTFDVTSVNAPSYYTLNSVDNATLTLKRGTTYTLNLSVSGHPFYIKTSNSTGTANAYNTGVTNNGATSGTLTFVVPAGAPNTLYYNCEFHGLMNGTINVTD
ncbi:MAG: hypothetical protein JNL01_09310 [Bdellovibrionales bacterium]|nr:hypothetical protein [Bdellovibrionales bacterium]